LSGHWQARARITGSAEPDPVSGRVLVVEDEGLVALLLKDYLHDMGVGDVTLARNLDAGLSAIATGEFDCAVLDVNLNGKRSDPIADALADQGIPFLFSTGYGREGLSERHSDRPFLIKPIQFAEFRDVVQRLLDRGASGR
jgi:CheY-like chemotaxis protein